MTSVWKPRVSLVVTSLMLLVPLGSQVVEGRVRAARHRQDGRGGATDCHGDAGGPLEYVNRPLNGSGLQEIGRMR